MTRVEVNYVEWLRSELRKINNIPFLEIQWTKNGVDVFPSEKIKGEWNYIGLNNTSFTDFLDEK